MAGRKSDFTLPTNTLDELFSSQEERDEAKLSKIRDIPLEEIDDFPDHPFQVREDEDMFQLVESISASQTLFLNCSNLWTRAGLKCAPPLSCPI